MVDYTKKNIDGLIVIIVIAIFSGTVIIWEIGQEWTKLYNDGDVLAKEKWTVYAERTWFSLEKCVGVGENRTCKSNWYATNVKCPKIEALGGHRTATRCYYPDDYYEMLKRSIKNTKINDYVDNDDNLKIEKSVPFFKYGTRGSYAGYLIESFTFINKTNSEKEFPKEYFVRFNPKDTRNYKLVWHIKDIDTSNYVDNVSYSCEYNFGLVYINLKEDCKHLNYTQIGEDEVFFHFNNARNSQTFDITFVDPPSTLLNNLRSYYTFDTDTSDSLSFYDVSTAGGVTHITSGQKLGAGAYYFDGDGDYINVSSIAANPYWVNFTQERSIAMWYKTHNPSLDAALFRDRTSTGIWLCLDYDTDTLGIFSQFYEGSYKNAISYQMPINDTWYHVVTTYNSSVGNVYINGVLNATVGVTGTLQAPSPSAFRLGLMEDGSKDMLGILDEVGIWNRSLTAAEVSELYNSGTGIQYPFTAAEDTTITLDSPDDDSWNTSKTVLFEYTPESITAFSNCSLYTNETSWSLKETNTTSITNDSANNITEVFASDGSYVWNVACRNTTTETFATANYTIHIDSTEPTIDFNADTTSAGSNEQGYIFINISVTDSGSGIDTVTLDFNGTNETMMTYSGNDYWINKTVLNEGAYDIKIYVNDTMGHMNSTATRNIDLTFFYWIDDFSTGSRHNGTSSSGYHYNLTEQYVRNNNTMTNPMTVMKYSSSDITCGNIVQVGDTCTWLSSYSMGNGANIYLLKSTDCGNTWDSGTSMGTAKIQINTYKSQNGTIYWTYYNYNGNGMFYRIYNETSGTLGSEITVSASYNEIRMSGGSATDIFIGMADAANTKVLSAETADGGVNWDNWTTVADPATDRAEDAVPYYINSTLSLLFWEWEEIATGDGIMMVTHKVDGTWQPTINYTVLNHSTDSVETGGVMEHDGRLWQYVFSDTSHNFYRVYSEDDSYTWSAASEMELIFNHTNNQFNNSMTLNRMRSISNTSAGKLMTMSARVGTPTEYYNLVKGEYKDMNITSNEITPSNISAWDLVHYDMTYDSHFNGSVSFRILDINDNIISGYENVSNGANISAISKDTYPTIKLQVSVELDNEWYTAYVEDWNVSWVAAGDNTAPTLDLIELYPTSPSTTEDLTINMTCSDIDGGDTLTAYRDVYKDGVIQTNLYGSTIVTNGTETLVFTIGSGNTSNGEEWIAEGWCGDATVNTSKTNSTTRTIISTEFIVYLNSPANNTETSDNTPDFNFTVNGTESTYSCELFLNDTGYGVNGTTLNDTATIITTNDTLVDGTYDWYINCTTNSITNQSEIRTITIDTIPPQITVYSPENISYYDITEIDLNWSLNEELGNVWYSLNGASNISLTSWTTSIIDNGLSGVGSYSAPTAFEINGTLYVISGKGDGNFVGYYWNGISWITDSSIISGLTDVGYYSSPDTFYKDGTLYLIATNDNVFVQNDGYNWSGTTWQSDSSIISGLSYASRVPSTTFEKDNIWYTIQGGQYGTFTGYNWTGSAWQSDTNIVSGLGDIGEYSNPHVFEKNGNFYFFGGSGDFQVIYAFNWSGTEWQTDNVIKTGLTMPGGSKDNTPTVFYYKNGILYFLAGDGNGIFNGYEHTVSFNTTISVNDGQNNITIYATDLVGNFNSSTVYFFVGNTTITVNYTSGDYLDFATTSYHGTFAAIGQNDTTAGINITNDGNVNLSINITVNTSQEACMSFWMSNDSTLDTATDYNVTDTTQNLITNLGINESIQLWTWMIFNQCTAGTLFWYMDYYDPYES